LLLLLLLLLQVASPDSHAHISNGSVDKLTYSTAAFFSFAAAATGLT
jgi:hypothetical protein